MKRQPRILAGTAIGLLMASAPLGAYPLQGSAAFGSTHSAAVQVILAQASCAEGESAEACAQKQGEPSKKKQAQPAEGEQPVQSEQKPHKKQQQSESAPAEQVAPDQEQQPRKKKLSQQQSESAPAEQVAPDQEQQPRKKKLNQQQQSETAPAEQVAPEQQQQPRKKKLNQQQQGETAPAEQAAPEQQQQPRKKKLNQQQSESAPTEQVAPDQQQPRKKKLNQQQGETAPAEQVAPEQQQQPRKKKLNQQQTESPPAEQPANDNQPGKKQKQGQQPAEQGHNPAEQPPAAEPAQKPEKQKKPAETTVTPEAAPAPTNKQPAGEATPKLKPLPVPGTEQAPAQGEQPLNQNKKQAKKPVTEQPATGEQPVTGGQPATGEQPATGQKTAPAQGGNAAQGEAPANPNEAPILDSQKDAQRKQQGGGQNQAVQGGQSTGGQTQKAPANAQPAQQNGGQAPKLAPADQGPPPASDKAAQQEIKPEKIVPVTEEKGKRIESAPVVEDVQRRPRPEGASVLQQLGDRVIIQFNNQTIVESNDAPRLTRDARDVYYEDLSGGRTREIVERDDGVRIITIRNRYGDVIRRSRITPDGREYVLSYVDERYYQDVDQWRDPGDDLPPMRLTIPRREYILDSQEVESPDDYYTFLEQPPVERVQRLYSIDEVKRSARVRDIARRIDLDTLNFDFGSATISDSEVPKLEGVANAMLKLLKKNPAETFLIEGHTDAVGTPEANLALSDRRAESVAEALTNAFGIPAENLTTQGYGEQYLKVNTQAPNRENRRVAIRRITSLVAPVASNSDQ
jgi:outer membrane protein OmpA-like peptidoglycan-associated protein